MKLSIIIPCYNEEKTLKIIIERVLKFKDLEKEIIIVDDCSTDNSKFIIKDLADLYPEIRGIFLEKNFGKGYAIKQGLKLASGGFIIIQDADLEYDPLDFFKLLKPIKLKGAKFVIGSRVLSRKIAKRPKGFISIILVYVNIFFSFLTSVIARQKITDPQSCYKLFSREVAKKINLQQNGFAFCNEIIFEVRKLGIKIHEVPISYNGRSYNQGKKINIKDGILMLIFLIKNLFYR